MKILIVCTTDSMIWNFLIPHIKELEKNGYEVECACSKTGEFFYKLQSEYNIKMNLIPFHRSPYRFSNIISLFKLNKLIKEKNIDLVFCHEPVGGAIGRIAGKINKCKVIYMAHGFHFYKGAPKSTFIYYFIEKLLAHFTDVLITINDEDYYASLKFKAKKNIKINGIGVDTNKFTINKEDNRFLDNEFNLDDNSIKLLSVGELITRKNHEIIIEALSKLNEKNIHYFIAGDGELSNYLKKIIHQLNLDENIHLLGYRENVKNLYNASDIFILPSIHEGLSVALMEAMGCGKPIIASRIRGNVDIVDERKGGILCSTFNISEYINAIRELSNSFKMREEYGKYNIERVKDFDITKIKNDILKIIIDCEEL